MMFDKDAEYQVLRHNAERKKNEVPVKRVSKKNPKPAPRDGKD